MRPIAAVVLDVGKTASAQHVIVALSDRPVEVRHGELVVLHVPVAHEVRGPGRLTGLLEVAR